MLIAFISMTMLRQNSFRTRHHKHGNIGNGNVHDKSTYVFVWLALTLMSCRKVTEKRIIIEMQWNTTAWKTAQTNNFQVRVQANVDRLSQSCAEERSHFQSRPANCKFPPNLHLLRLEIKAQPQSAQSHDQLIWRGSQVSEPRSLRESVDGQQTVLILHVPGIVAANIWLKMFHKAMLHLVSLWHTPVIVSSEALQLFERPLLCSSQMPTTLHTFESPCTLSIVLMETNFLFPRRE